MATNGDEVGFYETLFATYEERCQKLRRDVSRLLRDTRFVFF